jgi:hypothetical protein
LATSIKTKSTAFAVDFDGASEIGYFLMILAL